MGLELNEPLQLFQCIPVLQVHILSESRCNLFSQNTTEACAEDHSTVSLDLKGLKDRGQLALCKYTLIKNPVPYGGD